jgi:hypothetical protein
LPRFSYSRVKTKYQNWKLGILELTADKEDTKIYGEGWDRMGYHRPIGDWLFSIGTMIIGIPFGLLLLPLLKFTELRFPELKAFEVAAAALFGALYTLMDLELQPALDRFVPQYAVSDPKKAMQYVTFYIKYQMWTGLIQILFVATFVFLYIIPYTNFAYLAWFILLINIKQYPAILMTFESVLRTLQQGDKQNLIVFIRSSILEPVTKIVGGLLGLWWGMNNPAIGEMLGMAIGFFIGAYIDDFFAFLLGMVWLSKVLDKYGVAMWEIYGQSVPPDVWKSALGYSLRLLPRAAFSAGMGLFNFLLQFQGLPGYQSYVGLIGQSDNLRKIVGWSDDIINRSQPAYSEAYNNGKLNLTKYYIGEGLKYNSFFFGILGSINIFGLPLIVNIIIGVFLTENWALIAVIAPLQIIVNNIHKPFHEVYQKLTYISGHPEINTVLDIIGSVVNLFFTYYFLFVLELGWVGIILSGLPWEMVSFVIRIIFVNKKVIKLDYPFWKSISWQVFGAPIIGGAIFVVYLEFVLLLIWPIISAPFSGDFILIPLVIILIIIFAGLFFYMPIVSYLGFFDDVGINIFRRAVSLSGPSLWITWPLYKCLYWGYSRSPYKEKFKNPLGPIAEQELKELSILRHNNEMEYINE